ncbi:MAG TPA: hypothetical protein VLY85_01510 [Thermoplasmata archaeon]|nr:hypothetical protein [Thermoplasmata archaeon]
MAISRGSGSGGRRSPGSPPIAPLLLGLLLVLPPSAFPALDPSAGRAQNLFPAAPGATPQYSVTFTESGLTNGSPWSVTILGRTWNTSQPSLVLVEINGTYAYSAYAAAERDPSYPARAYVNGSFEVRGAPVEVLLPWSMLVEFPPAGNGSAAAPSASFGLGLSAGPVLLGVAVVLLVVVLIAVVARRPGGAPLPPLEPPRAPRPPHAASGADPPPAELDSADPLRHML